MQDSSVRRKAAFCEWDKKKITVIQRGVGRRREEEEEGTHGDRRKAQCESIRRRELSSEGQREAEEFGEKFGKEQVKTLESRQFEQKRD